MLSEDNTPTTTEDAIKELEDMMLNYYAPMTKEEWERNREIVNKVLESAGIGKDRLIIDH